MRVATMLLLLSLTACDGTQPGRAQTSDGPIGAKESPKDVLAANAAKDEAMIARDPERLARFYTNDYLLIDDDAALHDKPDQVQFMTQNVELLKARSDDVKVTMLAPGAALVTGRLTGRYRMDGKESDFTERYTGVWLREDGRWRVKHEHGSLVPVSN